MDQFHALISRLVAQEFRGTIGAHYDGVETHQNPVRVEKTSRIFPPHKLRSEVVSNEVVFSRLERLAKVRFRGSVWLTFDGYGITCFEEKRAANAGEFSVLA